MQRNIQGKQKLYLIDTCRGKAQGSDKARVGSTGAATDARRAGDSSHRLASCRHALSDIAPLEDAIITKLEGMRFSEKYSQKIDGRILHHHYFKIALSACPNACSQPQIKDFGVIAKMRPRITSEECTFCKKCQRACLEKAIDFDDKGAIINYDLCVECGSCIAQCSTQSIVKDQSGYTVLIGGKLGRHPQFGKELIKMADEDNVIQALQICVQLMLNHDGEIMRFGDLVNLVGLENIEELFES